MTDVLLAERRRAELDTAPPRRAPSRRVRRRRRLVLVASIALVGAAVGILLVDAAGTNHRYDHSRHVLAVTRGTTRVVARDLAAARVDLHLVTEQVGSDTTTLAQDTSQLEGARSALGAAQAHVSEQASLLNSLHQCLGGVEQALNALAVGDKSKAADALKWVATPCAAAVNASG
ncbi:MAG TPA: hypothetical protein VGF51_05065 [Acidimicrobiales bacterium]